MTQTRGNALIERVVRESIQRLNESAKKQQGNTNLHDQIRNLCKFYLDAGLEKYAPLDTDASQPADDGQPADQAGAKADPMDFARHLQALSEQMAPPPQSYVDQAGTRVESVGQMPEPAEVRYKRIGVHQMPDPAEQSMRQPDWVEAEDRRRVWEHMSTKSAAGKAAAGCVLGQDAIEAELRRMGLRVCQRAMVNGGRVLVLELG